MHIFIYFIIGGIYMKMKINKKKASIIAIVTVAILIILYLLLAPKNVKNKSEVLPTVSTEKVQKQQIMSEIQVDGTVSFKNKVLVYAKNTGKVKTILIKEGQQLNEGEVIVEYEKSALETLERQLEEAKLNLKASKLNLENLQLPTDESELKQLQVQIIQNEKNVEDSKIAIQKLEENIEKAKTDFENAKILYAQGAISLNEYNNFETSLKDFENQIFSAKAGLEATISQLEANKLKYEEAKNKSKNTSLNNKIEAQKISIEQAELRVNQLTNDINKFEVKTLSPSFGTVLKINVTEGESVTEGKVIAELGNLSDLIIEAYVPEYDMDGIKEGQEVKIKADANSEQFKGSITKVYPLAEKRNVGGIEKNVVKIEISTPSNTFLKAGYTTKLSIITNVDENALVIPIMAYMTQTNSDPYVFIVNEEGILEKRTIKLKGFQGSVTSVEGLKEDENVVANPNDKLQEGMKVKVLEQPSNGVETQPNAVGYNIKESTKASDTV